MRVPGFGTRSVQRILAARRHGALRYENLVAIGAVMKSVKAFVTMPGWSPQGMTDADNLRARFAPPPEQLSLL